MTPTTSLLFSSECQCRRSVSSLSQPCMDILGIPRSWCRHGRSGTLCSLDLERTFYALRETGADTRTHRHAHIPSCLRKKSPIVTYPLHICSWNRIWLWAQKVDGESNRWPSHIHVTATSHLVAYFKTIWLPRSCLNQTMLYMIPVTMALETIGNAMLLLLPVVTIGILALIVGYPAEPSSR